MDRSEDKTQDREAGRILSETEGRRPGDTPNPSVTTSSQASYRLLRRKRQSSLTALLLLSPQSLKDGFAGAPRKRENSGPGEPHPSLGGSHRLRGARMTASARERAPPGVSREARSTREQAAKTRSGVDGFSALWPKNGARSRSGLDAVAEGAQRDNNAAQSPAGLSLSAGWAWAITAF
jgi:hypothetical protein